MGYLFYIRVKAIVWEKLASVSDGSMTPTALQAEEFY